MLTNINLKFPTLLVEASYKLSLNEHRLILCALIKYSENKDKDLTITAQEISDSFEMPVSQSYRFLESTVKSLLIKGFIVLDGDNNNLDEIIWLESIDYKKGKAKVELKLSDELIIFLNNNQNKFITINSNYLFNLKTSYSIRLYEICFLLKENKQNYLLLEKFKTFFSLTANYTRFTNIKTRILEPAIKDINENTDLNVKYDLAKEGTKIIGLKFYIKDKTKRLVLAQRCEYTMDMFD